jgi:hypothetical protein
VEPEDASPAPRPFLLVVPAPQGPSCVARLTRGVADLVAAGWDPVVCDVAALSRPDLLAVDAVARMQLSARRHGGSIRLLAVPAALADLLDLAGLGGLVVLWGESPDDADDPGPPHLPWEVEASIAGFADPTWPP